MFIQDIFVDLEMPGMVEVMFKAPHPLKFFPKVLCCWIFFGDLVLYKVSEYTSFFCILMAHCNTIWAFVILGLNT